MSIDTESIDGVFNGTETLKQHNVLLYSWAEETVGFIWNKKNKKDNQNDFGQKVIPDSNESA